MSSYLEELQQKWNELLNEKVAEQEAQKHNDSDSNPGNGSGTSDTIGENSVLDDLKKYIEEQYAGMQFEKPELPDVPVYERMSTDFDSDEQIEEKAKSSLSEYANLTTSGIEEEISALEKKYKSDKEKVHSGYENEDKKLSEIYEAAKTTASNDMLKRGLARSSISANIVTGLDSDLGAKRTEVLRTYIDNVNAIESEISSLEVKRQTALNDFNIAYAAKLTESINKLKDDRNDKITEALKYNNSLTDKEYGQTVDKELKESDLYTEKLTQAQKEKDLGTFTSAQQEQIITNTYAKMDEILGSLSAKEAKALLSSSSIFRDNLNDYYYYKLYDKYGR